MKHVYHTQPHLVGRGRVHLPRDVIRHMTQLVLLFLLLTMGMFIVLAVAWLASWLFGGSTF